MTKPLVVITGASSGIGMATAKMLSQQGHALLLLARRVERLEALELPNCMCEKVDVTDAQSFKDAIQKAEAQFGPVDGIVNNAGVMLLGQTHEQDIVEWQRMVDVNIIGLLNGIHAVLNGMIQRNQGTIINVSSIAGRKGFPNHVAYCGTKFAVHGLSETLREEVAGHNVRVVTIAPGAVETELLGHTTSEEIKDAYQAWKEDMGSVLEADDIARAICYAYQQPPGVCVREIVIAATKQAA